jgi:hypothetical protein
VETLETQVVVVAVAVAVVTDKHLVVLVIPHTDKRNQATELLVKGILEDGDTTTMEQLADQALTFIHNLVFVYTVVQAVAALEKWAIIVKDYTTKPKAVMVHLVRSPAQQ